MPHTITKHPDHTVDITARLEPSVVETERETIARRFRTQAQIPGFRKGKAPLSAVRTRFAEAIDEELQEHLIGVLWRNILEEEKEFEPLIQPALSDLALDAEEGFSFKATVEVRPQWDVPDIDGVTLPEVSVEVTEEEIQRELEQVAEENGSWSPTESGVTVEDGHLVEAAMLVETEGDDGEPGREDNAQLLVGADGMPPEISEALQGAAVGDERTAVRTVEGELNPDDPDAPTTKTVTYTMTVNAIKTKSVPAIDDDLAKGIGFESLEELKGRVNEVVGQQKQADRRDRWRRAVLDHLEAGIDPETMPPSLVKDAVEEEMRRFFYQLASQGQKPDDSMNYEVLRARFEPAARGRVMDTLILEQCARDWGVEVPEGDVDQYIAAEAQQKGIPASEHKANLAKANRLDHLRHAALMAAVVSEMLRRAGAEEA